MFVQRSNKIVYVVVVIFVAFIVYLKYVVKEETEHFYQMEMNKTEKYIEKISSFLLNNTSGNFKETLQQYPSKRIQLRKMLHIFLNDNYQSIFVISKNQTGEYYLLLDSLTEDAQKNNVSIFSKRSLSLYDKAFQEGKVQIIEQDNKENSSEIWKSLIYPIKEQNQSTALLVVQVSQKYATRFSEIYKSLNQIVEMVQWFAVFSLIFFFYLSFMYQQFRKSTLRDRESGSKSKAYLQDFFYRENIYDYCMALLDIDSFSRVNEIVGFENGNHILKEFVTYLYKILPEQSEVIRLNGTEFALLIASQKNIEEIIPKIFRQIQQHSYTIDNEKIQITVSLSAMTILPEINTPGKILHLLDERMLEIKSRGKNTYSIIGKQDHGSIRYSDIDYIKSALDEERFVCLYQPIVDTRSKKILKYEALVRMVDDKDNGKLVSPFLFLSVIKGTSQYIRMTKLVMKEVFKVLNKYEDIEVSMNVDLTDLFNQEIMILIANELYAHKELAKRLTFEIVEDMEIKKYEEIAVIFEQLRHYGSKIALDDFGSGYANYNHLIQLDWDVIKIDGSLIKEIKNNPERTKIILQSINALGVYFQCQVVAEFVADEEIYTAISELCIECSQGFYFSEPKPIETFMHESETPNNNL